MLTLRDFVGDVSLDWKLVELLKSWNGKPFDTGEWCMDVVG